MSNRKTFNDFNVKVKPGHQDFLVGFDAPEIGGEKKFQLSHLKDFVHGVEIHEITNSGPIPVINPNLSEMDALPEGSPEPPPFLNGKVFHVRGTSSLTELELPDMTALPAEHHVQFMVVNLTDNKRVKFWVKNGTFRAKGVVPPSEGGDGSTYLRKKYDTAMIYYDGTHWYGHGDLDGPSSVHIKNVSTNYAFTVADEDKILHFNHATEVGGVLLSLPDPTNIPSGTQFFAHNISDEWIELRVPDGTQLHARAKFLRRKYDDAIIYTDGSNWFATGDLS